MRRQLAIPKPEWVCISGKGDILGRGHTLNALLRDTTIPGDDSQCRIAAPNGVKFSPGTLIRLTSMKML
jgi:hypothetical protein